MFRRLNWLFHHPEFKRRPVAVLGGVARWEWHRLTHSPADLKLGDIIIRARPIDGNGRLICYFGVGFDTLRDFLTSSLKPGMVFVDVGANIGSHAIPAAKLVGDRGRVYAYEADPDTYAMLADNVGRNGVRNVLGEQRAVSNRKEPMRFYVHRDSAKSSTVERAGKGSFLVQADLLDNLIPEGVKIDILKIDVEGADLAVLQGARRIFASDCAPDVVVIEVHDIVADIGHRDEIISFLKEYGYELFAYEGGRMLPISDKDVLNAYAVRRGTRLLGELIAA
jgi:FkbM family methyltransferase